MLLIESWLKNYKGNKNATPLEALCVAIYFTYADLQLAPCLSVRCISTGVCSGDCVVAVVCCVEFAAVQQAVLCCCCLCLPALSRSLSVCPSISLYRYAFIHSFKPCASVSFVVLIALLSFLLHVTCFPPLTHPCLKVQLHFQLQFY